METVSSPVSSPMPSPMSSPMPLVSTQSPSAHPWQIDAIPAMCITLERRADRWKRFQDQPAIQHFPVKRFLGVDGKTLDPSDSRIATLTQRNIAAKSRRSHEELDSIGGVGCALSHIAVWQWMVDNQQELCLIFEDDAVIPPDFKDKANQLIRSSTLLQHPKEWDIWLLGGLWDDLSSIPRESQSTGIVRIGSFVLFHAYVMTLDTAKRLLQDVYPIHAHIDAWTSIYGYLNGLRIIGSPQLRLQQNPRIKTDIQPENGCVMCNVPTNFSETHRMIPHWQYQMVQATGGVIIVYAMYRIIRTLASE